jgi:hypothetical protein
MAKLKLEPSWRDEFKRVGEAQSRDRSNRGFIEEPKSQTSLRWRGDEAESRRLQGEHHYCQWTSVAVVAAVIVSLIMIGLTFLH